MVQAKPSATFAASLSQPGGVTDGDLASPIFYQSLGDETLCDQRECGATKAEHRRELLLRDYKRGRVKLLAA
jgi:hypothetical protein